MAKTKVSEWSAIPANNTDVGGIDINEGCAPSGINNAIRDVMAQIKDMQTGADGDNFVVGGNLTVTGTTTLSTDLPIVSGGTGASTAADARTNLGLGTISTQAASSVTITGGSITGITDLAVADGGTGASTLTGVVIGNGTSAMTAVAPSTSGNVLTSNGTAWTSAAPAPSIGVGQTWQDVTGSRAVGTNYTNTTGNPIFISVSGGGQPNNGAMSMTVGGVLLGIQGFQSIASGRSNATMNAIVPNNTTYRVDNVTGWSLVSWAELR
jgi:hypothetical protein